MHKTALMDPTQTHGKPCGQSSDEVQLQEQLPLGALASVGEELKVAGMSQVTGGGSDADLTPVNLLDKAHVALAILFLATPSRLRLQWLDTGFA